MTPFFFGQSNYPIYGVSHAANGGQQRFEAILLCHPLGHEYIRSYRAIKQLAITLQKAGFFVMRFDYHGTGDSSGQFNEICVDQLLSDVKAASDELVAVSGQTRVITVGLRVGAMLAYLAAKECMFGKVIMWDPVIDGAAHVGHLKRLQGELLSSNYYYHTARSASVLLPQEFLGYQYSAKLIAELNELDISSKAETIEAELALFYTSPNNSIDRFIENKQLADCAHSVVDMGDWENVNLIESSLTTNAVIEAILKVLN